MSVLKHAAPLRQEVLRTLRQEILNGDLRPGERLLESALCGRYGVSRTVIREVLRQLESESLITMVPNRGPIVTVLTTKDIEALYEVRRSLEGLAGELFALNASDEDAIALISHTDQMTSTYLNGTVATRSASKDEFYRLLLKGAGNPVLETTLRGIHTRIGIFRHYAFIDEDRVALSMRELRTIVNAAAVQRDSVAARRACEEHIRLAGHLAVLEYDKRLPSETSHLDG
jgi:DNA-binding GntR family transcriptional regulator